MRLTLILLTILICSCHRSASPGTDDSDSTALPADSATVTSENNGSSDSDTTALEDTGDDSDTTALEDTGVDSDSATAADTGVSDTDSSVSMPLGPCSTTKTDTYDRSFATERWSETTYSADLTESVTNTWQITPDNIVETSTVTYDAHGRRIEVKVEYLTTDSVATTWYTWFDNGQMSMEHRKIENSDGIASEEMTTWNEMGMQLARMIRTGSSDELVLQSEFQYTFDEHGNCILVESRNSEADAFEVTERRVVTYRNESADDGEIATIDYFHNANELKYLRETHTRENGGRQICSEWFDDTGATPGVIRTQSDTWNTMGLPVSSELDYTANGSIEIATYYEYSPEGLLIRRTHTPLEAFADDEVTEYAYDTAGNLIREYKTWDSVEGDEIIRCTSLIEYTWDCWP
ncbi:MAG: hypothetical protein JXX14_10635 [Deltaproteobacteria bacterium]|nr:hypothetical protein [Deltaproteobacteria bacterium]